MSKQIKWSEIEAECGDFREGFVRTFRKYEGQLTDEVDAQGRTVKVTMASFARHAGIAKQTFRRWVEQETRGGPADAPRDRTRESLRRMAPTEQVAVIAETIAEAPPETQAKLAAAIVKGPTVEPSLRDAVAPKPRKPREPKAAEQKLGDAVFTLWEVGELLMDQAPTDAQRVRMSGLAEKAMALSEGIVRLLDSGEFEQAFRDLMDEVGAES